MRRTFVFGCCLFIACGEPGALVDAAVDAGMEEIDAGGPDAGSPSGEDAGLPDAGPPDAGPPPDVTAPREPCTDAEAAIYAASAPGSAVLGARLACARQALVSADTTRSTLGTDAPAAPSEVQLYLLAYRTTRRDGAAAASTARVFLPLTPRAGPLPVIALAHPSEGVADGCAPSHKSDSMFGLALPWAARGYAVIASDFAGLGTAGVQGYVDNHDTARSLLDSVRALRAFLREGATTDGAILIGYSQGGGAVLAAQGLEASYGSGGRILAAVAVAPEWFSRLDSFGYVSMLRHPDALTVQQGYTKPVVAALRHYALLENVLGPGQGALAFPAATRSATVDALEGQCLIALGAWLPSQRTRVRDLIDDSVRSAFLACVDGASGCAGEGRVLHDALVADLLPVDPSGAPIFYLQGALDTVMPLTEEARCNVPAIRATGVDFTFCTDDGAAHSSIFDRNRELVRTWAEHKALGGPLPTCTAAALLPCEG